MEENKLKSKIVETYTGDMVKVLESNKGSLIKKIIHEEEAHEAESKNLSPKSKKNKFFMLISITLIILALTVLLFLAFSKEKINTVSIEQQFTSIIFIDQTDFKVIDGFNKEKIAETVFNQTNDTKVKIGGIDGIYLTENNKVVGFKRFNELIKSNLDLEKVNLFGDNFLFGAFKNGLSSISPNIGTPFILLKVKSFTDVFPVMKIWENKMLYDLAQFFRVKITPETNYLFTKNFEDGVVANKNARMLKDKDGNIVLMYVYADDSSVVITNSENAVNEIVLRLNSSKIKK